MRKRVHLCNSKGKHCLSDEADVLKLVSAADAAVQYNSKLLIYCCQYQRNLLPGKTHLQNDLLFYKSDVKLWSLALLCCSEVHRQPVVMS